MKHTVYFGGGTPSCLGPDRLCRLLDAVLAHYRVAPDAEITLEANPDSAQELSALRRLRSAGFNRLSLGMQSADDAELARIGRIHTHAQTVRAVENARAAGFGELSLDLIYGLPEQWISLAGRGGLGKPVAGTLRGGNRRNRGYRQNRCSRKSRRSRKSR